MAIIATVTTQSTRPLENAQWEAWAQAVARGATFTQAAVDAGYSIKSAREQGTRLNRDKRVSDRVVAIKTEIVAELDRMATPAVIQAQSFIRQQVQERQYRLSILQDIVDRLRCVIDARAVEYKDKCPGGGTGLLVKQLKGIGGGANFREVEEYVVDRGTIAELREQLKQAAIESGDWDEEQFKPPARVDESAEGKSVEQLYAEQAILLEAKAKLDALRSGKSAEAHRVIEARPESTEVEVGVDGGTVAAIDDGPLTD